ncbi:hypothetical protein FA13DRAFT_1773220 [Coprinellus micaceus]|uniref:Uncharacterized protein n=1 Tax=Coprinellus micaceus TaxID=71717 RepID=A0A4Y7TI39_COPMI|nr:hypothetical protein FA13DRAFT_1773220 [Coprinellus micaceus]
MAFGLQRGSLCRGHGHNARNHVLVARFDVAEPVIILRKDRMAFRESGSASQISLGASRWLANNGTRATHGACELTMRSQPLWDEAALSAPPFPTKLARKIEVLLNDDDTLRLVRTWDCRYPPSPPLLLVDPNTQELHTASISRISSFTPHRSAAEGTMRDIVRCSVEGWAWRVEELQEGNGLWKQTWIAGRLSRILMCGGPEVPIGYATLPVFQRCFLDILNTVSCQAYRREHSRKGRELFRVRKFSGDIVLDDNILSRCEPRTWLDLPNEVPSSVFNDKDLLGVLDNLVHRSCNGPRYLCKRGCKLWTKAISDWKERQPGYRGERVQ